MIGSTHNEACNVIYGVQIETYNFTSKNTEGATVYRMIQRQHAKNSNPFDVRCSNGSEPFCTTEASSFS